MILDKAETCLPRHPKLICLVVLIVRNREKDLLERQSYYIIINPEISLLHFTLNCNFNDNWLIAVKVKNSCGH